MSSLRLARLAAISVGIANTSCGYDANSKMKSQKTELRVNVCTLHKVPMIHFAAMACADLCSLQVSEATIDLAMDTVTEVCAAGGEPVCKCRNHMTWLRAHCECAVNV